MGALPEPVPALLQTPPQTPQLLVLFSPHCSHYSSALTASQYSQPKVLQLFYIRITFNRDTFPFKRSFSPAKRRYLNSAHQWLQWFKLILGRPREIYGTAFSSVINTRWWDYTEYFHGCQKKSIMTKIKLFTLNTVSGNNLNVLEHTNRLKKGRKVYILLGIN